MAISENVKKALYMESAGYCENPNCNCSLLPLFESGRISNIVELAHIIGQKIHGHRGFAELELSERDTLKNILTLCPTCHTLIDKNEEEYPIELLYQWKEQHKSRIENIFAVVQYENKNDLKQVVLPILRENQYLFECYGPFSENAFICGDDGVKLWNKKVFEKILPNNRKVVKYLKKNEKLFSCSEMNIVYKYYDHCEEFEYNKVSGDKNPIATVFPKEIYEIWSD
ncbi:HNH endonuclease [[Ruminococcus] lactaris]|uniref:HNH endonuclease n=1 Tax=[Ruminococcus] lactaris TaxID=46228 RepID=UPI00241C18BD|nr:HNH endonuclease [[Ruminococcus] lactaris]MBS6792334.1 HNH endonuclease [[Ruminococcus] lactaris]